MLRGDTPSGWRRQLFADLAHGDDDLQDAIVAEGGLPPLLSLVQCGSPVAQEFAARAIWYLATSFAETDLCDLCALKLRSDLLR